MIIFEVLAVIAAVFGFALLLMSIVGSSDSAPALAAAAAVAIGIAVIPYCFVSILQRRQMRVDMDAMEKRLTRRVGAEPEE